MEDKTLQLRKRAQEFLDKNPDAAHEPVYEDSHQLIEELHIHQVELEMQNQELQQAHLELEAARDRYIDLYDFSPAGYITVSEEGLILEANLTISTMLGIERRSLIGKPFSRFITRDTQDEFYFHRRKLFETKAKQTCDLKLIKKDNTPFHARLACILVEDTKENTTRARAIISDISEQKRAEEEVHSLSQMLLKAQETERQMISCELHDRIAQELSAVKLGFDILIRREPEISERIREKISEFSGIIEKSILSARNLSYDLSPPDLDKKNIIKSLSDLCAEFSEQTGIKLNFYSAGMINCRLNEFAMINIYRLIQEGLNNVRKHAQASHVDVTCSYFHPAITLRIVDNGIGFDMEKRLSTLTSEKRMGLRSMQERVRLLGGTMDVHSEPKKGTKILINLPYGEKVHE
jgi:PAS domain S-box-containing protein